MNPSELFTGPLAQALGWALLHLLWQGTIVAAILAATLALMSRQSANARYVVACSALALVFALFVATAVRAYDPAAEPIATGTSAAPSSVKVPLTQLPVLIAASAAEDVRDQALRALASARTKLPSVVGIWLIGVVLLSARLLVSWAAARRLIHHSTTPATPEWQRTAMRLSDALGLRRAVTLLESAAVEVPSVIGSLRPVILLPASALTGMTPQQIEMVLAHEMAHIRRHDFLVNLLQAVVETLMFYHPAVWWMSSRVRIERENCCDDLAIAVCGNRVQYARALARLEELRANPFSIAVAANGGSLLDRVRRIAAERAEGTTSSSRWAAAVATLAIVAVAIAIPSLPALAERQEKKAAAKEARASVDVVEPRGSAAPLAQEDVDPDPTADPDSDPDPDPDFAGDFDLPEVFLYDSDGEPVVVPAPPMPPLPDMPAPALAPRALFTPRPPMPPFPAVAPTARTPRVPPVPAVAPAPAPMAIAAFAAHDFDFDFEYEYETGGEQDRELGAGGKLTVDELVALRSADVTPAYVNSMRAIFPGLTLRQVTGLSAMKVTGEFVEQMRAAGLDVKAARDATSLKAMGVTPEFIRAMRAAGLEVTTARDASSLKAMEVTPDWISEMRAAGFEVKSARDATRMKAVGVTAEWVRTMRSAGVKIESARDAASLRAQGVTPDFVKRLAAAGYTNLSARELSRLAAAGVDDAFIREMEQYRKKN